MALSRLPIVNAINPVGSVSLSSRGSNLYVAVTNSRVAQSLYDDPYDLVRDLPEYTPVFVQGSPTSTNAGVVRPIGVPAWAVYCDLYHLYSGVADPTGAPVANAFGFVSNPSPGAAVNQEGRGIHVDFDNTTFVEGDSAGNHKGLWIPLEDPRLGTRDLTFAAAYAARNSAIGSGWRLSARQSVYVYGAQSLLVTVKTAATFAAPPTSSMLVARFTT